MGQIPQRNVLYFRYTGITGQILRCVRGGSTKEYAWYLVPVDTLFDLSQLYFYDFEGYDYNLQQILDGAYEVVPPGALPSE